MNWKLRCPTQTPYLQQNHTGRAQQPPVSELGNACSSKDAQKAVLWLAADGQELLKQMQVLGHGQSQNKNPHFASAETRPLHIKPFTKPPGKRSVIIWMIWTIIWATCFFKLSPNIYSDLFKWFQIQRYQRAVQFLFWKTERFAHLSSQENINLLLRRPHSFSIPSGQTRGHFQLQSSLAQVHHKYPGTSNQSSSALTC